MTGSKTLYRSRDEQMVGGVCAGIADYFEIDPTIVRLVVVLLVLVSNGAIIVAYIVLWAVVPEEPLESMQGGRIVMPEETGSAPSNRPGPDSSPPPLPPGATPPASAPGPTAAPLPRTTPPPVPGRPGRGSVWLGVALIFVGVVLLVQMLVPALSLWQFWPVVIIVAGLLIIFRRGR